MPMDSMRWVFRFVFLLLSCVVDQPTLAQNPATQDKKIADVRVVIDVSGSMKQNDPNNLRQPALELLVKLLPEDGKAGVWTFGKYVNMLVPHRQVNDDWRNTALQKGGEINSSGLFTNIGEALEKSAYDVAQPSENYRTSIILLTDGMVDIDREPSANQQEWWRIVDQVLPKLKNAGYTIHTVALSDKADSELLNKLAVGTDGIAAVANSADELMKIFLAAFDNAAPAEQVALIDNAFVVDSSVEEFTALIFTRENSALTHLRSPDGEEYSFARQDPYLNWHRADKYDLITVAKPIEGEWQVFGDLDPDSRITVVSNLNLLVKPLSNNLFTQQTQTLSLQLIEDGKPITRDSFLALLDIRYSLERIIDPEEEKDGEIWQASLSSGGVPGNGVYSVELNAFEQEGEYKLNVFVDGKSFTREFNHTFFVRQSDSVAVASEPVSEPEQMAVSESPSLPEQIAEPKPEPASVMAAPAEPQAAAEMEIETEEEKEEGFSKWILYAGLAAGNLVILLLAYMAYRMIMGNKQDSELEELEQAVAELDGEDSAKPAKAAKPSMADMDTDSGESNADDTDTDSEETMPEDLDIADEDEEESATPGEETPAARQGSSDGSKEKDLGVTDVEFSVDDFSSESDEEDDNKGEDKKS